MASANRVKLIDFKKQYPFFTYWPESGGNPSSAFYVAVDVDRKMILHQTILCTVTFVSSGRC